ncbi:hypothetical protein HCA09_00075 [Listeria seeligeri]|uniref:hypothetical protein n=2 Tax=Listeria seeligeri TaxID=1640 RepID=UPI001626A6CC|nr:hypothetical protein [Listeria seeligeri]MBC1764295.1 hypothetical protein [Listeria seeligeri]MBC1881287.1 hypothetical protein [Listeria seeligeri]
MGKLKNILFMIVIGINLITLGGCGMGPLSSFDNIEEAQKYLLEELHLKYGEEFEIVKYDEDDYDEYPTANAYSTTIISKENPDYQFRGWTASNGETKDNYAASFFASQAEPIAGNVCKEQEYLIDYKVKLQAPITDKKWSRDSDVEEYMSKSGAYNRIDSTMQAGLKNEQYADQIYDLLDRLYKTKTGFELRVDNKVEDTTELIFMYNYDPNNTQLVKLDEEMIIEKIENEQLINETISGKK